MPCNYARGRFSEKRWKSDKVRKKEKFIGHCICKDGLTQVLDAIREADGLIIGSPNYLSEMTASFRALYERLIFQNLTYNLDRPS